MRVDPSKLLFAETHEWVAVESVGGNRVATIGISPFAVEQLTDLVYIELPKVGAKATAGKEFGEVESVKAVSALYSPVDGEIVAVNDALADSLEVLGTDAYGQGWMIKVKLSDEAALSKLMDLAAYEKQCGESH